MRRAVKRRHRQGIRQRLGHIQLLDRRLGIVGTVGPVAGRIDGQITIGTHHSTGLEARFPGIRISDGQRAGGLQQRVDVRIDVLGHRTRIDTADRCRIVGITDHDVEGVTDTPRPVTGGQADRDGADIAVGRRTAEGTGAITVVDKAQPGWQRAHTITQGGGKAQAVTRIQITEGDRSKGEAEGGIFRGHLVTDRIVQGRQVFTAVDRHRDHLGRAVGRGESDRIGHRLERIQVLYCGLIQGIGPGATGQLEAAVAVVTSGTGDIVEDRIVTGVHIRDRDRACGRHRGIPHIALGHRPGRGPADHRRILGTVDRDGDVVRRAVKRCDRQRVRQRLGHIQLLDRRLGIVRTVGPVAGRIDRQVTIGPHHRTGLEARFPGIRIRDGQRAGRLQQGVEVGIDILGHRTRIDTTDYRGVIGIINRYAECLVIGQSTGIGGLHCDVVRSRRLEVKQ